MALVTPIPKTNVMLDTSNYRPISVLSALSKVVERIIYIRLNKFLESNKVISGHQFGFRANSNTTSACLELTNFVSLQISKKQFVSCIFLDVMKAFDSVNHDLLLLKLKKLNFNSIQIKLFESYLKEREQLVVVEGHKSTPRRISYGVPQGSILGPLLFRIFINDITLMPFHGKIVLYADDAVLMYSSATQQELFDEMQEDLDKLLEWSKTNLLLLNVKKTKYMIFKNKLCSASNDFVLRYEGNMIEKVDSFVYLGLCIDSQLKWNLHVDRVKKKINPYIFAIRKTKNVLPQWTLKLVYNSYIISHITYLNPIWSICALYKLNELMILQKRAVKYILHVPVRHPSNLLFTTETKFISLTNICKKELLILAYKLVNKLLLHNFELIKSREQHNYNTRRRSHFVTDSFALCSRGNDVLYRGICAFNELSKEIKDTKTLLSFKKKSKYISGN